MTLQRAEKRIVDIMVDLHAGVSAILERPIDVVVYDKKVFDDRREAGASFEKTLSMNGSYWQPMISMWRNILSMIRPRTV